VSSKSLTVAVPLILASTMIGCPGVYLIAAPPFGALGPPAVAARLAVVASDAAPRGALYKPSGTAVARYCGGTLSRPST